MHKLMSLCFLLLFPLAAFAETTETGEIQVYFSPKGGCQDAIVREINAAQTDIKVQAYSFTNTAIAGALRDAHRRGVKVEVVLDKSQETAHYSSATFLHNVGIPVLIDAQHAIAHNKVMLIDGGTIITGSFNFSKAAEDSNAENLLVLKGFPDVFKKYEANYEAHRAHSQAYERPEKAPPGPQGNIGTPPPPPAAASSDPIVYVTTSGKKYHADGCRFLSKSKIPIKLSEAKQRGYGPCSVCGPPE